MWPIAELNRADLLSHIYSVGQEVQIFDQDTKAWVDATISHFLGFDGTLGVIVEMKNNIRKPVTKTQIRLKQE